MNNKKGINLMVLIITIVVILILVGAIMLMFFSYNPIKQAQKARFISDVGSFVDELELYKAQQYAMTGGQFIPEELNTYTEDELHGIVTSLKGVDRYANTFQIVEGKLCFKGESPLEPGDIFPPGLVIISKPNVTVVTASDVPVKSGTGVDYYITATAGVDITSFILNGNLKVVNEAGTELGTQPTINIGSITGTTRVKDVTVTINTTGMADGKYKLKILSGAVKIATDENETVTSNTTFELDSTAPEMPGFEITPSVLPPWMNSNVVVKITKTNAADDLFYSLDGVTYTPYTADLTVTANIRIYAKLVDKAQNASNIAILDITNIDKVAPTVTFATNGGNNLNQASTVTTVSDTGGSGINTAQYIWSTSTTEPSSGWTAFTTGATLTYTQNGTYYLWVKTADRAGNITTTRSNAFVVDITPPTAPTIDSSPTTWTNGNVTSIITYSADSVTKQYSVDGTNWSTYSTSVIVGTNNTTVYARGYDASGNMSTVSTKNITNIDKIAPTVAFSPNGGNGTSISTTTTASDTGGSGLNTSTMQYVWSNGTTEPSSGWAAFTNGTSLSKNVDGTYYLWIKATDNAGNSSTSRSNQFIVSSDVTPPTAPTITSAPTSWTNGVVGVVITYSGDSTIRQYSTDGTNWNTYSSTINISTNNTTVYARGYDAAGNVSTVTTRAITNIDTTVPTISFGTNGGSGGSVSTTVTVSDSQSGVSTRQYVWSTSTTEPSSGWNSFTNGQTLSWSTLGTYYLWIKSADSAGNVNTVRSNSFIVTDSTPPTPPTFSYSPTGWTTGGVGVTITYSGDSATKQYSTNGGSTWNTYSSTVYVYSNTTVYARAYDAAGNMSTSSTLSVTNIDTTQPSISFGTNGGSGSSVGTYVYVSDSQSGLNYAQYVWSTSTSTPSSGWANCSNGSYLSWSSSGTYYLWVRAYDNAGNSYTTRTNAFTIYVADTTPPTAPTLSSSPTGWTTGSVSVTITYSGDSSTRQYSTNGSTWYSYSSAVSVSTNNTTVYARAYDAAGNVSTVSSRTISNIDTTAPTVSISTTTGTTPKATATISGSDSGSGISSYQYLWTTSSSSTAPTSGYSTGSSTTWTSTGTYYLWARTIDGAGNISTPQRAGPYWIQVATLSYEGYVSSYKWIGLRTQPGVAGNSDIQNTGSPDYWGPIRLEALRMVINNSTNANELKVEVNAHLSNVGWQGYKQVYSYLAEVGGSASGINNGITTGPVYGIEALQMRLTGTLASKYKLSYIGYGPYGTVNTWVEAPGIIGATGHGKAMYGIAARLEVR